MRTRSALTLVAALLACVLASCAPDPVDSQQRIRLGNTDVRVYLADDAQERSDGLQGNAPLAAGEGMLFVFEDAEVRTFAMKDVAFPIDVLFISEDLVVSAVEPLDPGDSRLVTSPGPCRYVIELPQGWAVRNDIGPGAVLDLGETP